MDLNKDILRWVLLLAATPLWLPFLRILWRDFNRALEEEGGVFGRPPPPQEAERIRREKLSDAETLISEPWARRGEQAARRNAARTGRGSESTTPTRRSEPGTSRTAPNFRSNPRGGGERGGGFR
jgi:hypothetical protein